MGGATRSEVQAESRSVQSGSPGGGKGPVSEELRIVPWRNRAGRRPGDEVRETGARRYHHRRRAIRNDRRGAVLEVDRGGGADASLREETLRARTVGSGSLREKPEGGLRGRRIFQN